MSLLKRFGSTLRWAATGQASFIDHPDWLVAEYWMIDTKTGEYVHKETGERTPADLRSRACVNKSFYTLKKI